MKCQGKFKYKGLKERKGGEFVNSNNEKVSYKACYLLKVDEQTNNGIYERTFKMDIDSPLVAVLSHIELYQDIILELEVQLYGSNVKLIPVNVTVAK